MSYRDEYNKGFEEYKKYIRSQGVKTKEELQKATDTYFKKKTESDRATSKKETSMQPSISKNITSSKENLLIKALPTPLSMITDAFNQVKRTVTTNSDTTLPQLASRYNLNDPSQFEQYMREGIKLQQSENNKPSRTPYSPVEQKTYTTDDKDSWLGYTANVFLQNAKDALRGYGNTLATVGVTNYGKEAQSEFNEMVDASKKYYNQSEETQKVAQAVNDTIDDMREKKIQNAYQYVKRNAQASQDEWVHLMVA